MKRLFICTHFSRCTKIILSEGEGTARDRTNTKLKKKPRQITFYYRVNIRWLQRARLHNLFGERIQMGSSVSDSGTGGETEDGRTWRINNDELSGTYAVTFINSLLMTYLAVVGLTCVYCVNVQTLRWGQMFGRHVCTLINSVHAQRSCVCVCLCARTQTSTPTITSTHRHTHTRPLSLDILWESRREESSFPFAACWYLSCQLSKPTAGSWTDPSAELQTPSKNI